MDEILKKGQQELDELYRIVKRYDGHSDREFEIKFTISLALARYFLVKAAESKISTDNVKRN